MEVLDSNGKVNGRRVNGLLVPQCGQRVHACGAAIGPLALGVAAVVTGWAAGDSVDGLVQRSRC